MIVVANPVDSVRETAEMVAQKVLQTDMTNITMSQWQVEDHHEGTAQYVAFCAVNRRLDPLEKPYMLHMLAQDFDHLKMMFHYVDYVAGAC
jgi:hypothetical protein